MITAADDHPYPQGDKPDRKSNLEERELGRHGRQRRSREVFMLTAALHKTDLSISEDGNSRDGAAPCLRKVVYLSPHRRRTPRHIVHDTQPPITICIPVA